MTVTGCLKAGESADTFILSDLKWSDKDKAVGTAGSAVPAEVASATTLKVIPSASTKLTPHVGHTIEVTGTSATRQKTDSAPAAAPADPASPRPSASSGPSFEVKTLKMVSATCTP